MKVNLGEQEPELIKEFSFSINEPYENTITGYGPYNTSSSYALLPDFTGDSQSQAQSWANSHGLRVSFNGSGGYVISQNYPANKRIDLISGSVILTLSGGSSNQSQDSTTSPGNGTNNSGNNNSSNGGNSDDPSEVPTEPEAPSEEPEIPNDGDNGNEDNGGGGSGTETDTPPENETVVEPDE